MKSMYYIINNSDGDITVEEMTEEELIERLNEEYYGRRRFLNKIEKHDINYWGNNILIIKGEIIVPEPKTIIETYEV